MLQNTDLKTTKLGFKQDLPGSYTERPSNLNRVPTSYDRARNTIDYDRNNVQMRGESSPTPFRSITPPEKLHAEEDVQDNDEAKTFISSHLLFSHLMTFDTKKHTLSQLN